MENLSILHFVNVRWLNAEANYGLNVSKKLHERGHKIFVCGVSGTPPIIEAQKLNLPTLTTLKLHHNNPYYFYKDLSILNDFIKKEKIQIINSYKSEGHILGALAKKFSKNKLILVRTRGDVRLPKNYFINRWLYNYTDKIVTSAKIMEKDYFANLNVSKEKILTIYNAVDMNKFNPNINRNEYREILDIKNNEILIGMVGRLSPVKGHKVFLEAASIVAKNLSGVKFVVSGKESQVKFANLKSYAEELGIKDSITFLSVVDDVTKLISAIDIGVVASLGSETNCRVTLEFMSTAKPVVATSVGVIPEVLLDNKCGLIVPPNDASKLAEAILNLINNPLLMKTFGNNSRARIEQEFNEDLLAEKTEKLYLELLHS